MDRPAFARRRGQGGVAMVEFAIVLPLLLLLLFAIAELGRMLFQYNSLLQASRDAGRYVSGRALNATLGQVALRADLQTRTRNLAAGGVASAADSNCTASTGVTLRPVFCPADVTVAAEGTQHVRVTISYSFRPLIGSGLPAFIGGAMALNFPLVATTVMRAL
ncbi:TadE-like protein [compost metagenome]